MLYVFCSNQKKNKICNWIPIMSSTTSLVVVEWCRYVPEFVVLSSGSLFDSKDTSNRLSLQSLTEQQPHSCITVPPTPYKYKRISKNIHKRDLAKSFLKLYYNKEYSLLDSSTSFFVGHLLRGRHAFFAGKPAW